MEIYLIRHTTPNITPGLIYGHLDVDLTDSFLEELAIVKQKLPATFEAVYSSPSRRCTQLARQLATNFVVDDRLRELHFGDWEGKTWDAIDQQESQAWMDDFVNVPTPGGESLRQMHERVAQFWQDLLKTTHRNVAVVTHGGVIRLLLAEEKQRPLTSVFEQKVAYGDVVLVRS
ncbi:alpha-ribazole phosphatase [Spirosoma jeollabukense]